MSARDAAVAAAQRGWRIFPCLPGDKRPAITSWESRASADPEHITHAWDGPYAGHNIGLACGPCALYVLDLDCHGQLPDAWAREPGIVDGQDVLATLAERAGQGWPHTLTVRTPSGGRHLYFQMPTGIEIRNSASKIGPMIDGRGHGGYVIAAGSVTEAGTYEMLPGFTEPAPIPPWLLIHIFPPPDPPVHRVGPAEPVSGPAPRRLRGLVARLLDATEGERNSLLYWSACRGAALVADGEASADQVRTVLARAAEHIGLHDREIQSTINSAFHKGGLR
jgi:hypothetical protein